MRKLEPLPPLAPSAYLRRRSPRLPFPLDEPSTVLFASARQALFAGLGALGITSGDAVLAPAYHCGAEIEPMVRLGVDCQFYDAGPELEPDPDELDALRTPATRALFVIDHLGFPQDGARWRAWCDERGLAFVEDAAPAWLASRDGVPAGALADLAVFSLNKQVAVPDGGAAVRPRGGTVPTPPVGGLGLSGVLHRHASWLMTRSGAIGGLRRRLVSGAVRGAYDLDRENELGPLRGPGAATRFLAPRLATDDVAARRRRHYRALLEVLGAQVPPPFDRLPDGAAPFAFPVVSERKAELLAHLEAENVVAFDLWSVPHPVLSAGGFPRAARRRATTVGLPVHHGLSDGDVARIARLCGAWFDEHEPDRPALA
jgi:dTDP-4-amino-4,6-dideoxygalactose transaminase